MGQLHTILGASGASGLAMLDVCQGENLDTRAVTRSRKLEHHPTVQADLLNPMATDAAIAGSDFVYMCAAMPYQAKVWLRDWPKAMSNIIAACQKHDATLVFLDNIYMYGPPPLPNPFDEDTPQQPISQKGRARKQTADLLIQAFAENRIQGVIGRSADFYGPGAINSMLYVLFLERMLQDKNPQFLGPKGMPHTYANTQDNARAMLKLAQNSDTYQQVWHLPVGTPITIEEATRIFNGLLSKDFNVQMMPPLLQKMVSLFYGPLREVNEMLYQFQHPYIMSWEKFRTRFPDFQVTAYESGFKTMIESFQKSEN